MTYIHLRADCLDPMLVTSMESLYLFLLHIVSKRSFNGEKIVQWCELCDCNTTVCTFGDVDAMHLDAEDKHVFTWIVQRLGFLSDFRNGDSPGAEVTQLV